MSFKSLTTIASDVKAALVALEVGGEPLFRDVRRAAITNHEQLLEIVAHLSRFPAAVVCIGPGHFQDDEAIRNVSPGILIVDRYRPTMEKSAVSIWDAVDHTLNAFITDDPETYFEINGITYKPSGWRPVALKGTRNSAYLISMETLDLI